MTAFFGSTLENQRDKKTMLEKTTSHKKPYHLDYISKIHAFQPHERCRWARLFLRLTTTLLFMLLIGIHCQAQAAEVRLLWEKTKDTRVVGYKMYWRIIRSKDVSCLDVGNRETYTVKNLRGGQIYGFRVTAYDGGGNESDFSDEVFCYVQETDSDADGISDVAEKNLGTDVTKNDSDEDGINDGDEFAFWKSDWDADHDADGIINLLDSDADNDGLLDGVEIRKGTDPGDFVSENKALHSKIEVGSVDVDHEWKRIHYKKRFRDPIVVAKMVTANGTDPSVVRISNVDQKGFRIRIQEWFYLDEWHTTETISYLVIERGTYRLSDGAVVEAGSFDSSKTTGFHNVSFEEVFTDVPVVVASVASFNGSDPVTGRIDKISPEGFGFRMQEEEARPQFHVAETIMYIAWDTSTGTLGDLVFDVAKTGETVNHETSTFLFSQQFLTMPILLHDMQTCDGNNTATVVCQYVDHDGFNMEIWEEQSLDNETWHVPERAGYMAFAIRKK